MCHPYRILPVCPKCRKEYPSYPDPEKQIQQCWHSLYYRVLPEDCKIKSDAIYQEKRWVCAGCDERPEKEWKARM